VSETDRIARASRDKAPRGKLARCAFCFALCVSFAASGCQKTYYTVMEQVGVEKREILSSRVKHAKESQREAQKDFRDALEKFQAVTGQHGGELEDRYESLRSAYERSQAQAHEVSERIDAVEDVADALLDEWKGELARYEDASLRERSAERLRQTRGDVQRLLRAMHRAEQSLNPVLHKLQDRVLYLKHNLNAAALAGLDTKVPELERDVAHLVNEMQASIAEADRFMAQEQVN